MFSTFEHEGIKYLIDKSDPDILYHFCINNKNFTKDDAFTKPKPFRCTANRHNYYYHGIYWYRTGKDTWYCPWCTVTIPKEINIWFKIRINWFNVICLECETGK